MSSPSPSTLPDSIDPDPAEALDDPYVHTVSTEAFVEAVEAAGHQEAQPLPSAREDNDLPASGKRA